MKPGISPLAAWLGCGLLGLTACTHNAVAPPKPVVPAAVVVPPPAPPAASAPPPPPAPETSDDSGTRTGEEHLNQLLQGSLRADQRTAFRKPITETEDLDTAIGSEFHDFIHPPAYDGIETAASIQNAVAKAKRRAAGGDPFWLNYLGFSYVTGKGVPRDTGKGVQLITRAAAGGNDKALCTLARLNEIGLIVPMDKTKAIDLYKECARKEPGGWSMLRLGQIYEFGFGVPRDSQQAMHWYVQAATDPLAANVHAAYAVGRMYAKGIGVSKNYHRAHEWFLRAAGLKSADKARPQRSREAVCALAIMYKYGVGVDRNPARSDAYLDLGREQAQNDTGEAWCKDI